MLSEVREFIEHPDAARFEELALGVFRFQYQGSAPYRMFCDRRGADPESVRRWSEIPAVPVAAFKLADLAVSNLAPGKVFLTSGTTGGVEARGRHRVPDPSIYRAGALRHFQSCVLPDEARLDLLVLAPSPLEEPQSSLCAMIGWIDEAFGADRARYFLSGGELDSAALAEALRDVEPLRKPVLLIGLTHAFVRFMDRCRVEDARFRLPYGSRIVDTGGGKGLGRTMSRAGVLRAFWEVFGVPGYFVANEYGMTEMCSQFYDSSILDHFEGRKRDRRKIGPPWVRTQIISAETGGPVEPGERGWLRHLDLANVGSVAALETEDLGVSVGEGFEVIGRAPGAEVRGCAMLLEEVGG